MNIPHSDCDGRCGPENPGKKARICMPTLRNLTRRAFRSGLYEAQDVLTEIDDVDLIHLEPGWSSRVKKSWLRKPLYHDVSKTLMFLNPGLHRVRLTQKYLMFIAVFQNYWDLPYINAIHNWRDSCDISICWLDEIWAVEIPGFKHWLHALNQFDHIFVGCKGSVAPLSQAIGRPCTWLPGGVDTLRFNPYPNPPARVIDVYSIGRRYEAIHHALIETAARDNLLYVYDTFPSSNAEVYNYVEHRNLFAQLAKRSRFFVVAPGKMDDPSTGGQAEVGYRYFEGAAAGTVMIGRAPQDCESYRALFDWPNAVLPLRDDGSDVGHVVASLSSDPNRLSTLSRRNIVETVLRHDWGYRWKELFRVVGVPPSPRLTNRVSRLQNLAHTVSDVGNEPQQSRTNQLIL